MPYGGVSGEEGEACKPGWDGPALLDSGHIWTSK